MCVCIQCVATAIERDRERENFLDETKVHTLLFQKCFIYRELLYYVEFLCILLAVAAYMQGRDVLKVFEFFVLITTIVNVPT